MKTPKQIREMLSESDVRVRRNPITATKTRRGGMTVCRTVSKKQSDKMTSLFMRAVKSKPGTVVRGNPSTRGNLRHPSEHDVAVWTKSLRYRHGAKTASKILQSWKQYQKSRHNPRNNPHPGHFPGKSGTGSRFAACKSRVESFYAGKGRPVNAGAVCATIGRHAYGAKKFQKLAIAGKRRRARR